jgi:hypothetical protein
VTATARPDAGDGGGGGDVPELRVLVRRLVPDGTRPE